MALTAHAQLVTADSRVAALESQIQALLGAAATATEAVNARGDTVVLACRTSPTAYRRLLLMESIVAPPSRLPWCKLYLGMISRHCTQYSLEAWHRRNLKTSSTTSV